MEEILEEPRQCTSCGTHYIVRNGLEEEVNVFWDMGTLVLNEPTGTEHTCEGW